MKTKTSQTRQKRSDTLIRTLEKEYKVDFGVRPDMKLGNYLKREGLPSLSRVLKRVDRI
jgi:hypothetical protein